MRLAHSRLLSLAADGYRIVTPDSLHASMLAERYVAARLPEEGPGTQGESWERPGIQSIDAWLTSWWQEMRYNAGDVPMLLSTAQELILWREVIAAEGDELLHAEFRWTRRSGTRTKTPCGFATGTRTFDGCVPGEDLLREVISGHWCGNGLPARNVPRRKRHSLALQPPLRRSGNYWRH